MSTSFSDFIEAAINNGGKQNTNKCLMALANKIQSLINEQNQKPPKSSELYTCNMCLKINSTTHPFEFRMNNDPKRHIIKIFHLCEECRCQFIMQSNDIPEDVDECGNLI